MGIEKCINPMTVLSRPDIPGHVKEAALIMQGVLQRLVEANRLHEEPKPQEDVWEEA